MVETFIIYFSSKLIPLSYLTCLIHCSGFVAERVNLRYFLSFGMILSGIASYFFGLARVLNIHDYSYFVMVQVFGGIVQTTGWPGVVTVVGNWFGKNKRGKILNHLSFI